MLYSGWIKAVCSVLEYTVVNATSATPTDDDDFNAVIPDAIDYVENRLQRDLDFVASTATSIAGTMTANSRTVTLPTNLGTYIVASQIRPIVEGIRQQPLEPVSRPFLDFAWPNEASMGANTLPQQWCPNDQASVLVGPAPDQNYPFEVVGTVRFPQLSATNTSNFLTLQVPDLYVAASLVFFFGYQRDFGAQAEDPGTAQSWENQYQTLLKSAQVEEARKEFMDMSPSPSKPTGLTAQTGG